jgi:hypothetical protein
MTTPEDDPGWVPLDTEPRWDQIDRIPDDMQIYGNDWSEDQWTLSKWREALGHPAVTSHGYCQTCGPGTTCMLMAFFDAVLMSVVRELDATGQLVSPQPKE